MNTKAKPKVRLSNKVNPLNYKITLYPDLEGFLYKGEEEIVLNLLAPTNVITLHARGLIIPKESVRVLASKKKIEVKKVDWNEKEETVIFTFVEKIPKGKAVLSLGFEGVLAETLRGFYKSKYLHDGKERHLAVTQFEATDARGAFPCFDEPAMKAVFDVSFVVPQNFNAISNTLPTSESVLEDGRKKIIFSPTPKMSTYLLAFIVGEFEHVEAKTKDGVLVRVFVTHGKKHQATFALDTAVKCLEFFNDFYGIKYPLPSMDMIGIPDFAAGAMENWGAVTYRESQLLVDPENSSAVTRQWTALTIAHELAHQWFGNLVTMEWWTHLWLNEGFASYMEYVAVDHIFPDWNIWQQFVYIDFNSALELDCLANTHPIEVPVNHPDEIGEIFDAISYHKGASVIRMLAEYLGEKDFKKGLHQYLKTHSYGNAQTEDLWKAFQKASGKPVLSLMNTWIKKAGYPYVQVVEGKKGYEINQSRFFSSPVSRKVNTDRTVWGIPLSIATSSGKEEKVFLNKKSLALNIPKNLEWFKLNANETTPVRIDYPADLLEKLCEPIESKKIKPIDRLGIVRDAFAFAESDQLPTTQALKVASSFKNEDDYNVWAELSVRLAEVKTLFRDESFYEELRTYLRNIYTPAIFLVGYEPVEGEGQQKTMLRSLILMQAGANGNKEVIKWAQKLFNENKHIHPDLRGAVYNLAIRFGGKKEYKKLLEQYKTEQMAEERNRLMRALGQVQDEALILELLDLQTSKFVRLQDGPTFIGSLWVNHAARKLVWEHLKKNFDHYEKTYGQGGHTLDRIVLSARVFHTKEFLNDFKKFFAKRTARGAERAVKQVIEQVESNILWLKRDAKKVQKILKTLNS